MAYALIDSVSGGSADALAATTGTMNSTGATLFTAGVASLDEDGDPTITDTYSNTLWIPLTSYVASGLLRVRIYYHVAPTVGAGHSFTVTSAGFAYPAIAVQAWSGAHLSSPYDTPHENGRQLNGDHTAGSVTPSQNNCLVVAAVAFDLNPTGWSISGMTLDEEVAYGGGTNFGLAMAHVIQTTSAVANETWSHGGSESTFEVSAQAVFAPAAAAASSMLKHMMMHHGG